jgi:PTH1 family peptidyl-tRNA hydrolase
MRLVLGIGNPGPAYDGTRHNLGFRVVDALAAPHARAWRRLFGLEALCVKIPLAGWPVLLVKPLTYVNRAGPVARVLRDRLALADAHVLAVVDDLDLRPGAVRLRPSGGTGGHNGLRSLAEHLETEAFPRLRLGIGPARGPAAEFVLGRFDEAERPAVDAAVARAVEAAALWVRLGAERAMATVNRRDLDRSPDPA